MCIICDLKAGVAEAMGYEVKKEVVGKLDAGTLLQLQLVENDLESLDDEVEKRKEELALQAQEQLRKEFEGRFNKIKAQQREVYDGFYGRLGLEKKVEYQVNKKGEVFKEIVLKDGQPVDESEYH